MSVSLAALRDWLAVRTVRRLWVAYSGGVDSQVLLHRLAAEREQWPALAAVYVNHGLHPDAAAWGEHCAAVCAALAVPLTRLAIAARPAAGESPEAAARNARYRALGPLLAPDDVLLTAQHADDQAETLLLQLLRGGGPHGLAAMPFAAPLGTGWQVRPLLDSTRADIMAYATTHALHWIEDSSNADTALDRNYLRHQVLPTLRARWPALARTLGRSARLCAEAADLLDAQAAADLAALTDGGDSLPLPPLCALPAPRRRNVLRAWLRASGLPLAGSVHMQEIDKLLTAAANRVPCVRWPGVALYRYRQRLYAVPPLAHDANAVWTWPQPAQPLTIPGIGRLHWEPQTGAGLSAWLLTAGPLTIRFRHGGERFRPCGRAHGQTLKKLWQEAGIPPWQRTRQPLIYLGERLVWVGGLGVAAEVAAGAGAAGYALAWQKPPPSVTV